MTCCEIDEIKMRVLNVSNNKIGIEGAEALLAGLINLRTLLIHDNRAEAEAYVRKKRRLV
jgi:hypothetical protein